MNLSQPGASIYVPDSAPSVLALSRVTHLGIGAHQDDLEFMAFHGIAECYQQPERWFGGVTCTNGTGSARSGQYAHYADEQMRSVRREEQNTAAELGEYGAMIQLDHPSAELQERAGKEMLRADFRQILSLARPRTVYTHNLADKHCTHVSVAAAVVEALRELPAEERPDAVYGCEVWRDLDWMPDGDKVALNVSAYPELAEALNRAFDSQIAGGKRYDLATLGRRRANATFYRSHETDTAEQLSFAMDLTPLVRDGTLDLAAYVDGYIERFRADVQQKIRHALR
jgi:LmbE family N-acetylglucosaminyl deacetylase